MTGAPRDEAALDRMADMWALSLSLRVIASELGVSRSIIAGKIGRARDRGDARFPPRTPGNQHSHNTEPGAPAAKSAPEAPEVAERRPGGSLTAPSCRPRRLVELRPGQCRFPINSPDRGGEFLFCSAPVTRFGENYCADHAVLVRAGASSSAGKAAWR
jgi:hypothetical protein